MARSGGYLALGQTLADAMQSCESNRSDEGEMVHAEIKAGIIIINDEVGDVNG